MIVELGFPGRKPEPMSWPEITRGMKFGLPVIDVTTGQQADCGNCRGLCCRKGMMLSLSEAEKEQMEAVGTQMKPHKRKFLDHRPKKGENLMVLTSDCGNLGPNNECTVYDNRPRACRELPVGSLGCIGIRESGGKEHMVRYPQQVFKNA